MIAPALIVLAGLAYYWPQLCPTFYFWDSAELTAAVLGGGVPHQPGFPLVLLLAKAWVKLVMFPPSFGLNLFSAVFAVVGLGLWYEVGRKILLRTELAESEWAAALLSLISVILLGISFSYSIQAVRFEVYSLNFAGFAWMMLLVLYITNRPRHPNLLKIMFFVSIGLFLGVHHLTIALALPGIILLMLLTGRLGLRQLIPGLLLSAVIGLILYLTIPMLSAKSPLLNWGEPSNFSRLWDYILVKGFSVSSARLTGAHFGQQADFVFQALIRQMGWPALAFSLIGLFYFVLRKSGLGISLLLVLLLNFLSVAFAENYFYENYDLHGYLVIGLAVAVMFAAVGLAVFARFVKRRFELAKTERPITGVAVLTAMAAVLSLAFPIKQNFLKADLSQVKTAETYSARFLADAPSDAMIITSSYNTYFCLLAYRECYPAKSNQVILNLYNWDHPWGQRQTNTLLKYESVSNISRQNYYRSLLNEFMKTRAIFIEYDQSSSPIASYLRPHGLGYLFTAAADSGAHEIPMNDDSAIFRQSLVSRDIESVRTWALWMQSKGDYYHRLKNDEKAALYFSAVDSLAGLVELQ